MVCKGLVCGCSDAGTSVMDASFSLVLILVRGAKIYIFLNISLLLSFLNDANISAVHLDSCS